MKKVTRLIPALVCLILFVSILSASAEIYKYTDDTGNIRYTDDLNMVPVKQREMVDEYAELQTPVPPPDAVSEADEPTPLLETETDVLEAARELNDTREALEKERARLIEVQESLANAPKETDSEAVAKQHMARLAQFKQETQAYEKKRQAYEQDRTRYNARVDALNRQPPETATHPETE